MAEYDCLIIGYNDFVFEEYVEILRAMGTAHADYRDLHLNFLRYNGKPYRALDLLTHFYYQDKKPPHIPFHNAETLWMVITYLGTYLARRGLTFDYLNLFQLEKDRLTEKLENNKYLTIVITTTIYNFEHPILEAMSWVRQTGTTARIIVGGPYISKRSERLDPENLLSLFKYIDADFYVCSREGEEALVNIIRALKGKCGFTEIPNIAYRSGKEFFLTPTAPELNDLEENMVDYSLFPREDLGHFVNLRFSKGCPYRCSFCGFPHRTVKYTCRSVENIKKELDDLRKVGTVERLHFTDDTVNVPLPRFKEILRMMIRENYGFQWNCYFRCDRVDDETVELMRDSGCEGVFLGLESANATILKNMNKTAGKEPYREFVPKFKEAGIATFMSVFIGFPGETVATFRETMDFLAETRADFYRPQLWYCDPMTPIWKQREKYGLKGYNFAWSHQTMDAKTACDLLEKAFLSLDEPVWVPDPGYNYISVYLLKQRGMSLEKQKTFLRCFNAVVKEKILYPHQEEISPGLLKSLEQSCRFDEPGEVDMGPVLALASPGFIAAEQYWLQEFGNPAPPPDPARKPGAGLTGTSAHRTGIFPLGKELVDRLGSLYKENLSLLVLAAYSTLLLRLNGREDTAVLTALDEKAVFPLRLYPLWSLSFGEYLRDTCRRTRAAMTHRLYGMHMLTHPTGLAAHTGSTPVFAYAYWVDSEESSSLEERLTGLPNAWQRLELILKFREQDPEPGIQFLYPSWAYSAEAVETLGYHLLSILNAVSENPGITPGKIGPDPGTEQNKAAVEAHSQVDFNF
jgi:anaerobic magnesium-protoporphyrin IX monomethyl ester cyclase